MIRRFLTLILAWVLALGILTAGWWSAAQRFPDTPISEGFDKAVEWATPLLERV